MKWWLRYDVPAWHESQANLDLLITKAAFTPPTQLSGNGDSPNMTPWKKSAVRVAARCAAIALACATLVYALPRRGDPDNPRPDPEPRPSPCVPAATGSVRIEPSVVPLIHGLEAVSARVAWSSSVTRSCNPFPGFFMETPAHEPYFVEGSGSWVRSFNAPGNYTFTLKLHRNGSGPPSIVASGSVLVVAVPMLSAGNEVTQGDLNNFDYLWMRTLPQTLDYYEGQLALGKLSVGWDIGERVRAMVDMYEVTRADLWRASTYVDHLMQISQRMLRYRDDRRVPPAPLDTFRPDWPTPMPSWGKSDASSGNYWTTSMDLDVSGQMLYGIASFARIVAEDTRLQAYYGEQALDAANAVLESFEAYYSRWQLRQVDGLDEKYMQGPPIMSQFLGEARCQEARAASEGSDGEYKQCTDAGKYAGNKEPHNLNHTQLMAAIEVYRVITSPFYLQSSRYRASAADDRARIVHTVRSNQRFFENSLRTTHFRRYTQDPPRPPTTPGPARFIWQYMEDSFRPHYEDISHAAVAIRYLGQLQDSQHLLNMTNLVTLEQLGTFANTFLYNVAAEEHLAHDVTGRPVEGDENRDAVCDGWLSLARADARVYEGCAAVIFRVVNNQRPNLREAHYAALLRNKRYRSATAPAF